MFLFFYFTVIVSSILMIVSINPINAVLFLIGTFISAAMIFLMWNVEFFALIFIIIYVGAIAVLFLFIVMMINIKRIEKDNTTYLTIGAIILFVFGFQLFLLVFNPIFENNNMLVNDENMNENNIVIFFVKIYVLKCLENIEFLVNNLYTEDIIFSVFLNF